MKLKTLNLFSYLILLTLTSCFGLFDSGSDKIVQDYEVAWIDTYDSRSIYRNVEIVGAYIYAVGHNSKFIVAKQHPKPNYDSPIDLSVTNYFIVKLTDNKYTEKKDVFGPLNKNQFDSLQNVLGVGQIEFDLEYPENP
jgi:hypothetical protein